MNQILEEQLSACLDGELPPGEMDLILARLDVEPGRRATLARYAMVGECLRSGAANPSALGVAERVRLALIADAAERPIKRTTSRTSHQAWIAGAVAAAVALIVVFVAGPGIWNTPVRQGVASNAGTLAATGSTSVAQTPRRVPIPATRLTGYLMAHGEYTNQLSRSTFDSHLVTARAERVSWPVSGDPGDVR